MKTIDIEVSGDSCTVDLEIEYLEQKDVLLRLVNDTHNPATQVFLNLPAVDSGFLDWNSVLTSKGPLFDLLVLLKNSTHIHNGNFSKFENILFSDHRILDNNQYGVVLDDNNHYPNVNLIIENFRTKSGFIFSSNLTLLKNCAIDKFLGVDTSLDNADVFFKRDLLNGSNKNFIIKEIEFKNPLRKLLLENLYLKGTLTHHGIKEISTNNCELLQDINLENIPKIGEFSVRTHAVSTDIVNTNSVVISKLIGERGKFYISANSYIDFKLGNDGGLKGVDLILDMSKSNEISRSIVFPAKRFEFDMIKILGATNLSMPMGGSCRILEIMDCQDANCSNVIAANIKYYLDKQPSGSFMISNSSAISIISSGTTKLIARDIICQILEGKGLCNASIYGNSNINAFRNNLELDESNRDRYIQPNMAVVFIENSENQKVVINQLLAKISTFHVKGNAELGTVVIKTIDNLHTLFWVQINAHNSLKIDGLMVSNDHGFFVNTETGDIAVCKEAKPNAKTITGGNIYASVQSTEVNRWMFIKSGQGISFNGNLRIINGDFGVFSDAGSISINGYVQAAKAIMVSASQGQISTFNSNLAASSIVLYAQGPICNFGSVLESSESLILYSLEQFIHIDNTNFKAKNITLLSKKDVLFSKANIESSNLAIKVGGNFTALNSEILSGAFYAQAAGDFILAKTGINLKQYRHTLFADHNSSGSSAAIPGIKLANDITIIGTFSANTSDVRTSIDWKMVDFTSDIVMEPGSAYIDANKGYIIGTKINADEQVIIRTKHSIEIVPAKLYNETIRNGGLDEESILKAASAINAGLIDIDAGKAALLVGSLLKAATGKIKAESLYVLNSPDEIKTQQERLKTIRASGITPFLDSDRIYLDKYFNFSDTTSISQTVSNLSLYSKFVSKNLSFTQQSGNLVIDRSIDRYESLHINVEHGTLLIVSKNLQNIYAGNGGRDSGLQAANDSRIIVGGDNVYLSANNLEVCGAKIKAKGDLKIVTKNGVHILPVSVHERLMYHIGSKTTVTENIVRNVISEIDAGFLDIKAGGAVEAVSALIGATGVKIDASSLRLSGEREIFEKHVHFVGKEKWYGGKNSSSDLRRDELVTPTIINAHNMEINVTGDTTIEAAKILTSGDSSIKSGGDIKFLPLYNIHLHDHTEKKAYLFKCHNGNMTIAGTKSAREYYKGQTPSPTIYYSGGSFYGYSDGAIHLLGAKIVANDIYLSSQKGIKLEACPFTEEKFISVHEKGFRTGFQSKNGSHSFKAELFNDMSEAKYKAMLYEASEIHAKNHLTIDCKKDDLEIISSKMRFAKANIWARDLKLSTYKNEISHNSSSESMSTGLHVGAKESFSSSGARLKELVEKKGTHWLDILDTTLKTYASYRDLENIASDIDLLQGEGNIADKLKNLKMIQGGVWGSANYGYQKQQASFKKAVDNLIQGGDLEIVASNAVDIEGIECYLDNLYLKAKAMRVKASSDEITNDTISCNVSIEIPILGNTSGSAGLSGSISHSTSTLYHGGNKIHASGNMEIDIDGDGRISGVRFEAGKLNLRAKNLVLESLQDLIEERMTSASIGVSFGENMIGGSINIGGSSRDAAWTNAVGALIGNELVNIVIEQNLEIAGGLIANAEIDERGQLTDKGKLCLKAGNIIARKLHDYDNGVSYGLGLSLASKFNPLDGSSKESINMPIKYGFDDQYRDLLPTIGKGVIDITNEVIGEINRSAADHISNFKSSKAMLDSNIPVSDILDYLAPKPADDGKAKDKTGKDSEKNKQLGGKEEPLASEEQEANKQAMLQELKEASSKAVEPDFENEGEIAAYEGITEAACGDEYAELGIDELDKLQGRAFSLYKYFKEQGQEWVAGNTQQYTQLLSIAAQVMKMPEGESKTDATVVGSNNTPQNGGPFIGKPQARLNADGTMPLFNATQPGYLNLRSLPQKSDELPRVFRNDAYVVRVGDAIWPVYPDLSGSLGNLNSGFSFVSTAHAYSGAATYGGADLGIETLAGMSRAAWGLGSRALPFIAEAALPVGALLYLTYKDGERKLNYIQDYNYAANTLSEYEYERIRSDLKPEDIIKAISVLPLDLYDISNPHDYECIERLAVGAVIHSKTEEIKRAKQGAAAARAVIAEGYGEEQCAQMLLIPDDELLQKFTNDADFILPISSDKIRKNILGTFKHTELQYLVNEYEDRCKAGRFLTEVKYYQGSHITQAIKGSSRFDVLATDDLRINTDNSHYIYNMKFGDAGSRPYDVTRAFNNLLTANQYTDMWPTSFGKENKIYYRK